MIVAVMAQIVTMFRRRPGTAADGVPGVVMAAYSCSWFATAVDMPSRAGSERRWLVSMVA
jgi:hypothetical protein